MNLILNKKFLDTWQEGFFIFQNSSDIKSSFGFLKVK